MSEINTYRWDHQQALTDAINDPILNSFIDQADIEYITYDGGDGMQYQAQILARGAVKRVLERLINKAREAGVDLKDWICSEENFDLCGQLDKPLGQLMRQLNDFLKNKWTNATTHALSTFAAFSQLASAVTLGKFLAVFAVIGFLSNAFIELCGCLPNDGLKPNII